MVGLINLIFASLEDEHGKFLVSVALGRDSYSSPPPDAASGRRSERFLALIKLLLTYKYLFTVPTLGVFRQDIVSPMDKLLDSGYEVLCMHLPANVRVVISCHNYGTK